MRDTFDSPLVIGFDRNNETVVANCHQFILDRFFRTPHQTFQRTSNAGTQSGDLMSDPSEFRACTVVKFATRQDLVGDARNEAVEFTRKPTDYFRQNWTLIALGNYRCTRRKGLAAKTTEFKDCRRVQRSSFHAQPRNRFCRVAQFAKRPAHTTLLQLPTLSNRRESSAKLNEIV